MYTIINYIIIYYITQKMDNHILPTWRFKESNSTKMKRLTTFLEWLFRIPPKKTAEHVPSKFSPG